jgi:integrase
VARRNNGGSVVLDKRSGNWQFFYWENGGRRSKNIGHISKYPTKAAAFKAAKPYRQAVENQVFATIRNEKSATVTNLIAHYRDEKMPKRPETRRGYEKWFRNHIEPKWGGCVLVELQAKPVELWLNELPLAPKSKGHIRGLLSTLWNYAMWRGDIPTQVNPIDLVTVKGVSKRKKKSRSMTVEEFQVFVESLSEPKRTIAFVQVCFGARISEALGLKWSDIDWQNRTLTIERGVVRGHVDDTKSEASEKPMHIGPEMLSVLKAWRKRSDFAEDSDWVFASPVQHGRMPWSHKPIWVAYQEAARAAGIKLTSAEMLGTHALRHTYRMWLDSTNASVGVQQKLMRHADIRTTMNIYGDAMTPDMKRTSEKIARLALVPKKKRA